MRHVGCYPTVQYYFGNILKDHAFNVLIKLILLILIVICPLLGFELGAPAPQFDEPTIELISIGQRLSFFIVYKLSKGEMV